jgi:shikimate 5-dehydrogenase
MNSNAVSMKIGPKTRFILSTSGRLTSLERYQRLLQSILNLDVAYIPIHSGVESDPRISPQQFVHALKGLPCIGGAISRDIKHSIIPFLDDLDDSAKSIDSVNTVIVSPSNRLIGYNTDVIGFRIAIIQGLKKSSLIANSAVCYGYGGTHIKSVSNIQFRVVVKQPLFL